eukprot:TRINITY_DN5276_c0_g1_i5.p1 TRINITY_DN5276_c0_g1~~TRINITY_DN5276_c0_g1_i5.p1  ORF type:complete len:558 (-),score=47.14 TRINITY_DN5276_c0_g1_i5:37-1611(-)
MDAEAFLDIACAAPVQEPASIHANEEPASSLASSSADNTVPAPTVLGSEERIFLKEVQRVASKEDTRSFSKRLMDFQSGLMTFCMFFVHVAVYSLLVPFVCTLAVIPLLFEEIPFEIWESYYWVVVCGAALYFSESTARRCVGFSMSRRRMGVVCLTCASLSVIISFTPLRNSIFHGVVPFTAVMLALYAPVISRFATCIREEYSLAPLLWYVAFMTWGATPCAISVLLYYGLVALAWKDDIWMLALAVSVWSVVPFFVKAVGWKLVYRGSPKAKFVAPVLWILYCDLAFGTLGLPLFMHSPRASLTYAASILPILLLHMARGAGWFPWCNFCRRRANSAAEVRVIRVNALLEALCAVQGRAVAYTVYFTMMALTAIFREGGSPGERYSLLHEKADHFFQSVNIYRYTPASALDMLAAVFGLCASWGSFCLFSWLLPCAWALSAKVAPADSREANCGVDTTAQSASNAGWMLGGDRAETLHQQYKAIMCFFQSCRHNIVSEYAFQLAITTTAVNMAELIIHVKS